MRASALTGVAAATTALAVILSGCGSDSKPAASSSSSSSSEKSSGKKSSTSKKSTATPQSSAGGQTIADYINTSGIVQTTTAPGEEGAPDISLPIPEGWVLRNEDLPDGAYGGIAYTGPDANAFAPTIFSYLSKLTGNVDPGKILELAPNEVLGLDGYESVAEGAPSQLGGFDAYELAGTYSQEGKPTFVAQKTVVIPGQDGIFLLQLNAYSVPEQQEILGTAMGQIDAETTIE